MSITTNCSLSALIENKIFSVHGGLSPAISTLDQVRKFTLICLFLFRLYTSNIFLYDLLLISRYELLIGSKKYLMMVPCVTFYGQILKILWITGVLVPAVLVTYLVAVLLLPLTTPITLTIYVVHISW